MNQQMTIANVAAWLSIIEMDKYASAFALNKIDGAVLAEMDKLALAELGVTALDQAKIIAALKQLNCARELDTAAAEAESEPGAQVPLEGMPHLEPASQVANTPAQFDRSSVVHRARIIFVVQSSSSQHS